MTGPRCSERRQLAAVRSEWQRYELPGGATHLHLANEDSHRACAIGFRTPSEDDSGVAHILEHTVLCGSRRYPVRDPFFAMLRRSLATELNAATDVDCTAYYFATQVARDVDHLLAVYLDAVFAPLLDRNDLAQEGHRLELVDDQPQRKGVVFNEMKGAYATGAAHVDATLAKLLWPDVAARFDSGGVPLAIPDLDHDTLVARHHRWYVPANLCVVTWGNIEPERIHAALAPYLEFGGQPIAVPALQTPHTAPRRREVAVPLGPREDPADVGRWCRAWTAGDAADVAHTLDVTLLDELLFGHAGAPLRHLFESQGLGRSLASTGCDTSQRNVVWRIEFDGVDPRNYDVIGPLVDRALETYVPRKGFSGRPLETALHQLELAQRDLEGADETPGLSCCLRVLQAWNIGADPLAVLDPAPALAALRERWADPAYGVAVMRRTLTDNPSWVEVRSRGDTSFLDDVERSEAERCWADVARLGPEGPMRLRIEADELQRHQRAPVDVSRLPTLTLDDIPAHRDRPQPSRQAPWIFTPRSNDLISRAIVIDAGDLGADLALLPLLIATMGETGVSKYGYARQAERVHRRCTGIEAWFDLAAVPGDPSRCTLVVGLEARGLADDHRAIANLLDETLHDQCFHDDDRLRECLDQELQGLREDVVEQGDTYASWAARTRLGGTAALAHGLEGLGYLAWLRRESTDEAEGLGEDLAALLARLQKRPRTVMLVGDRAADLPPRMDRRAKRLAAGAQSFAAPTAISGPDLAYTVSSSVSFHARVVPTIALTHADAPAIQVAAHLLTNHYLLPRIREHGGAYGAAATYQPLQGTFACTSYRDPRLTETLRDLDQACAWLRDTAHQDDHVREAILTAVSEHDAPGTPTDEARSVMLDAVHGLDTSVVDAYRQGMLRVDNAAIRAAADHWLVAAPAARASLVNHKAAKTLTGWQRKAV